MILLNADGDTSKYFEPVPLRKTKKPFVRPDRIHSGAKVALVLISDIYQGPGLKGVPRGSVSESPAASVLISPSTSTVRSPASRWKVSSFCT